MQGGILMLSMSWVSVALLGRQGLSHTFFVIICRPKATISCFQVATWLIGTPSPFLLRTLRVGDSSKAQTRPVHSVHNISHEPTNNNHCPFAQLTKSNKDKIRAPRNPPRRTLLTIRRKIDRTPNNTPTIPHSRPNPQIKAPIIRWWIRQHRRRLSNIQEPRSNSPNHLSLTVSKNKHLPLFPSHV